MSKINKEVTEIASEEYQYDLHFGDDIVKNKVFDK